MNQNDHLPKPAMQSEENNVHPPVKKNEGSLYHLLDAWRAVAAIAVVAYHATEGTLLKHPELLSNPFYKIVSYGKLGVQAFFVISGYCIMAAVASGLKRGETGGQFFVKRVRRIYPPYIASLLLFYVLGKVIALALAQGWVPARAADIPLYGIVQAASGFWFWLSNMTLTQLITGSGFLVTLSWTLCYEIAFYLIAGLVAFASKPVSMQKVLLLTHAVTIACAVALLTGGQRVPYPFDMWVWFGAGVIVYDQLIASAKETNRWLRWRPAIIGAITALILAIAVTTGRLQTVGVWHAAALPPLLLGAAFVLILLWLKPHDLRISQSPWVRPLMFVGTFSYSLYLVHPLVIWFGRAAFNALSKGQMNETILTGVIVLLAIGFSYGFHLVAEKPWLSARKLSA